MRSREAIAVGVRLNDVTLVPSLPFFFFADACLSGSRLFSFPFHPPFAISFNYLHTLVNISIIDKEAIRLAELDTHKTIAAHHYTQ